MLTTRTGTHVDAPLHFVADGAAVDALPLEILIGKCRVVEVAGRERIDRADLRGRSTCATTCACCSRRGCRASSGSRRSRRTTST